MRNQQNTKKQKKVKNYELHFLLIFKFFLNPLTLDVILKHFKILKSSKFITCWNLLVEIPLSSDYFRQSFVCFDQWEDDLVTSSNGR